MKRTARHASIHNPTGQPIHRSARFVAAALLCALFAAEAARAGDPLRYRPGLRNSPGADRLNAQQIAAVLRGLRDKTGFAELHFDEHGFLSLGDRTNFSGGSETARQVLIATIEMKNTIELEVAQARSAVSFARITNLVSFQNRVTGQQIDSCSIQVDFSDFTQLRGDRQAIAAFDLGLVVLHELGHAVLNLRDTYDGSPGDCEVMVNRIRRELNLPERQTYIAQIYQVMRTPSTGMTKFAELIFVKNDETAGGNARKFYLNWEARQVGPILDLNTLTASKPASKGKPVATSVGQ
jgi:hypothetical protein